MQNSMNCQKFNIINSLRYKLGVLHCIYAKIKRSFIAFSQNWHCINATHFAFMQKDSPAEKGHECIFLAPHRTIFYYKIVKKGGKMQWGKIFLQKIFMIFKRRFKNVKNRIDKLSFLGAAPHTFCTLFCMLGK